MWQCRPESGNVANFFLGKKIEKKKYISGQKLLADVSLIFSANSRTQIMPPRITRSALSVTTKKANPKDDKSPTPKVITCVC